MSSKIADANRVIQDHVKAIDLSSDPWWKLVTELGGRPVFDDEAKPKIQMVLVWASRLITSVAPDFAEDLFARIRRGGLNGVRAGLREMMEYSEKVGENGGIDPQSLSDEAWLDLRERCRTRAGAARELGCDTHTVKKYAVLALGVDPWSREAKAPQEDS